MLFVGGRSQWRTEEGTEPGRRRWRGSQIAVTSQHVFVTLRDAIAFGDDINDSNSPLNLERFAPRTNTKEIKKKGYARPGCAAAS